jgi:hypothetical protein
VDSIVEKRSGESEESGVDETERGEGRSVSEREDLKKDLGREARRVDSLLDG